jgi:hypothetical protein
MSHVSSNVGIAEYDECKIVVVIFLESGNIHKIFDHLQVNQLQIEAAYY